MRSKRAVIALGIVLAFVLVCVSVAGGLLLYRLVHSQPFQQVSDGLGGLLELQQKIDREFPQYGKIGVSLTNGHIVTVTLGVVELSDFSDPELEGMAEQVARYTQQVYPGITQVDTIRVVFSQVRRVLFFTTSVTRSFIFPISDQSKDPLTVQGEQSQQPIFLRWPGRAGAAGHERLLGR